jgi:hypothetical protein
MPQLYQREPIARLADPRFCTTFNGASYLDLMKAKIRVATHQVMHVVRGQVRKRLQHLVQQLNRKIWTPGDEPK